MADLDTALAGVAKLDAAALSRPWTWRDGQMDVRYALYRTLEEAQEALVGAAAAPHPEPHRILSLAQRAFGDLRGLVVGLSDDLLDRAPEVGEWPLREVLRHVLVIERRYAMQTVYAVERGDGAPLRISAERLARADQPDASGDVFVLLGRIAQARAETDQRLGDLAPAALERPTGWVHYQVDVRFRLHRFAAHLVEHTVQCEKTLDALGWRPTEGRSIARRVSSTLGELEGLGAQDEARDLAARLVERLASVSAEAAGGTC